MKNRRGRGKIKWEGPTLVLKCRLGTRDGNSALPDVKLRWRYISGMELLRIYVNLLKKKDKNFVNSFNP